MLQGKFILGSYVPKFSFSDHYFNEDLRKKDNLTVSGFVKIPKMHAVVMMIVLYFMICQSINNYVFAITYSWLYNPLFLHSPFPG